MHYALRTMCYVLRAMCTTLHYTTLHTWASSSAMRSFNAAISSASTFPWALRPTTSFSKDAYKGLGGEG